MTAANETPANRFTDKSEREWVVTVDYAKLRKIRNDFDVDLGNTIGFAGIWAKLLLDDITFQEILWVCIDRGDGTTVDAFMSQMDGDTLPSAQEAMLEALIFFIPKEKRGMMRSATEALMKGYREAMENSSQMLAEVMNGVTSRAHKRLGKQPRK